MKVSVQVVIEANGDAPRRIRACLRQRSRREGWFEMIAGKSMPSEGAAKCFAFVQTYDAKPKRRLFELLRRRACSRISRSAS